MVFGCEDTSYVCLYIGVCVYIYIYIYIYIHTCMYVHKYIHTSLISCKSGVEYPTGTYNMPWWASCVTAVIRVVSCPPCMVPVDTKSPAGLPTSAPFIHKAPVESRRAFIWAGIMPKRVGKPKSTPSTCSYICMCCQCVALYRPEVYVWCREAEEHG